MKKNSGGGQSSKPDRKTIERRRRNDMKTLCFKLTSLIPHHIFKPSKETVSQQDQLDLAAAYISHLRERIETLKKSKEESMKSVEPSGSITESTVARAPVSLRSPMVELRDLGSRIELVLITGLNRNFMLYQVISILEQEGAEVAKLSRVGIETTRACQRLQELIK
ncbi:putative Polygalacturonase 2 [Hibiscus syriacus]|uniref:Polygalacturonase 2 n=1 Tax=Hibiscus syriacus TaxID=106335 RepID=A0A6A3BTD6_HIBSY|nr:putative Polygalacturonase 2 [Hibiscus syriacus]